MDSGCVESMLLQKCISILDNMKYCGRDDRPKTEAKLHNVLQKVANVCYVSSVLNVVFKYGKEEVINISGNEKVTKSDKELDECIATFALKEAGEQNRELLVLPCDSNLHLSVASKIEEWYKERTVRYNKDNPIDGIARASCYPYDLDTDEIAKELTKHKYLHVDGHNIELKSLSVTVGQELAKAYQRFRDKIRSSLDQLSARSHELFAREIIEANTAIQKTNAEAMQRYCERHYASKYSMYRKTPVNGQSITGVTGVTHQLEKMETREVDMSTNSQSDTMETDETSPIDDNTLLPNTLSCEAALVLVQLYKTRSQPQTMSDLDEFIRKKCGVMYVISPKYILSNIIKENQNIPEDFEFNLDLGGHKSNDPLKLGNLTDVVNRLTFPGKDKIQPRPDSTRRFYRYRFTPMDTGPPDMRKEIFKAFQNYVSKETPKKAERYRCVPIFMDQAAEIRCKERFLRWVKEVNSNPNKHITKDTFTKELLDLSYEFTRLPVNDLVKCLVDGHYLQVNEQSRSIEYTLSYKRPTCPLTADVERFQKYWEDDFKPKNSDDSNVQMNNIMSSRKRPGGPIQLAPKRPKLIDI